MPQRYPAVRFVVRHGSSLSWIIPAVLAIAGLLTLSPQWNPWLAGVTIVGAAILFCVLRVIVELVQIIAETLLPQ